MRSVLDDRVAVPDCCIYLRPVTFKRYLAACSIGSKAPSFRERGRSSPVRTIAGTNGTCGTTAPAVALWQGVV